MSANGVNEARRRFLIGATSAVGAVGIVAAAVPFVESWTPSAKARALGAPIKVDISKLEPGEMLGPIPAWRGKPIFVVRRTTEALELMKSLEPELTDPESEDSIQPPYATNEFRSRDPMLGVIIGICTHLGCSPKYYGKAEPESFDPQWKGGFFCPCHGSRFDLAGRVFKGVPAPTNLEIPPYFYETDNVIVVGLDQESA